MAVDGHQTAVRLHQRVVPGQVAERAPRAEGRDGAVDDPRTDAGGAGEVEPELVDRSRPEALHEDVGPADQAVQDLEPTGRLQVERQAFLVAIQGDERGALATPVGRGPGPGVVPTPGPLDLDDLGAHVSEGLRAERTRHVLGQIGDDDALQRVRHARESITGAAFKNRGLPAASGTSTLFVAAGSPALESMHPMAPNAEDL